MSYESRGMNTFTKKDYLLGLLAGFVTGVFLLPVLANISVDFPFKIISLFTGIPLAMILGLFVAGFLSRWVKIFYQFSKFIVTGFMNAAVDFGILNVFLLLTGVTGGFLYSIFKGISFIAANINSYVWNKFWTFKGKNAYTPSAQGSTEGQVTIQKTSKEYVQFLIVSLIGLGLNVGAASFVVSIIGAQFGLSASLWANVGAVCGSAAGLLWNFIGYKLIVFRR